MPKLKPASKKVIQAARDALREELERRGMDIHARNYLNSKAGDDKLGEIAKLQYGEDNFHNRNLLHKEFTKETLTPKRRGGRRTARRSGRRSARKTARRGY